jgi:TDG/mug DNA glycosylase family protein
VVFVGTAASTRSASVGHYYAHPGNRFWRTIHEVGLTPRRYEPHEFRLLLKLGIGFTDVSKSGSGMDHQISKDQIDVGFFETKMRKYKPRAIAFTSKKAASFFFGKPTGKVILGRQQVIEGFSEIFVLPSTSGAASRYWTDEPWRELTAAMDPTTFSG